MKKSLYLISPMLVAGCLAMPTKSYGLATVCQQIACPANAAGVSQLAQNCQTTGARCYGGASEMVGTTTCETCRSGYVRVSRTFNATCATRPIRIDYYTCLLACTNSNCKSDTSWSSYGDGYERRILRECSDSTTCKTTYSYRCAAGYYGSSSNGTSGCNPCPSGGTSSAGTTSATGCYIPSGTTGSDSTGTYKYTSNCYWKN